MSDGLHTFHKDILSLITELPLNCWGRKSQYIPQNIIKTTTSNRHKGGNTGRYAIINIKLYQIT